MELPIHFRYWGIIIHTMFWIMLGSTMVFVFIGIIESVRVAIATTGLHILGIMFLVYVHINYLVPRFFEKEKYLQYSILLISLIILTATYRFYMGWGLVEWLGSKIRNGFTPNYLGSVGFTSVFFLLISIPLRLIDNWLKKRELENQLKTHQLEAELRFLKARVNPHFLFNALNNIYALSFVESKNTPEMILKLSDMMSYMLYDCKTESVQLSQEIGYLHNYIALQQLKKEGEYNIELNLEGSLSGIKIPPMLFIPFFENAFKHGNLDDTLNGWLKSSFKLTKYELHFKIENSYLPNKVFLETSNPEEKKGGIGLENVAARLKLLYPGQHQFSINKAPNIFSIDLKIML